MKDTLVVIPYVSSPQQGNEIELALFGWLMFAKFDFTLIVIGDKPDCIDKFQNVKHIPFEKPKDFDEKNNYLPHIDVARKFDKIRELYKDEYDGFIWTTDDDYPIKPFDLDFLKKVYYLEESFVGNKDAPSNYWSKDMYKTRCLLDKEKKPHLNYATHHPMWYDFKEWDHISKKFDLAHNSYIRENIYFNYYKHDTPIHVSNVRLGIWSKNEYESKLENAFVNENIKFVVNSVRGYSKGLENRIRKHYYDFCKNVNNIIKLAKCRK